MTSGRGRGSATAVAVGLGSNLPPRREHLRSALAWLGRLLGGTEASGVYASAPEGSVGGDEFLNLCARGTTTLTPGSLLLRVLERERRQGRRRSAPEAGRSAPGPRTLDLDLLLYGDAVHEDPDLVLPHPRMRVRPFVLLPLAEIAGDWIHPVEGVTVAVLAARMDGSAVRRIGEAETVLGSEHPVRDVAGEDGGEIERKGRR